MKFSIIRKRNEISKSYEEKISNKILELGGVLTSTDPDIVISIGGDGTFLDTFHNFENIFDKVGFLNFKLDSSIGFYAVNSINRWEEIIEKVFKNEMTKFQLKPLLLDAGGRKKYFLNEVVIRNISHMLELGINFNSELVYDFFGDGLCISGQSGSTAYNKSLGGSVIFPGLEAIQIVPIAQVINSKFKQMSSPMIFPSCENNNKLTIKINKDNDYSLSIDNIYINDLKIEDSKLSFRYSKRNINLLSEGEVKFTEVLFNTFIK